MIRGRFSGLEKKAKTWSGTDPLLEWKRVRQGSSSNL
jgi:hypothetical protein